MYWAALNRFCIKKGKIMRKHRYALHITALEKKDICETDRSLTVEKRIRLSSSEKMQQSMMNYVCLP